ncbi:unnamed protein product [Closterium sp. NIES-53]
MIHTAAPHFLWPFAVWYAAHQLNLLPHVSFPETSPTLRWMGKVGDASVFQVRGSRAFVRDTSADMLSARAIPCVFLGFSPYTPGWHFYHPTSRRGPAPSGVSQVDPLPSTTPIEVAVDSGAAPGAASGGAASGGAEPGGAGGLRVPPESVEPGGTASEGSEPGGAEPRGTASSGGPAGAPPRLSPRPKPLSPQQLHEWFSQRTRLWSGAAGAGISAIGDPGGGGDGVTAGVGGTGGAAADGLGGARTGGTGAAGTGGVGGAGAGDPTELGAAGAGGAGAVGTGAGGSSARGAGAGGAGAVDPGAGGVDGSVRPRSYFVPLLQQTGGLTKRREPASHLASPVNTGHCVPRLRPPRVPDTHAMTLRPSSIPVRVPLPPPPESSLPALPDPESDRALDFAAACRLDYATARVAESVSASHPSVGGECALGTDVLEDRQEDFECLAVAVPSFASMLLAPERDLDAPDITTPRSYAEAITGTYIDAVPPSHANIVDGMWIFRVKRLVGSPPTFKARYIARGFSQRQGVDYFHTFSTPKMTTLWVLLHVAAQRDYELHSLDFSTAFLQGSLHEEIWLRPPPSFTGSFPAGAQWSLWRPIYSLHLAPCEWHDTLKTTLAALGFAPSTAYPSMFLRTDTSLPPFYVLVCRRPGPSALWLPVLLAIAHSSVYLPLALSSTFGRVRKAGWSVRRACGLPHVPDDGTANLCSTSGMGLVLGGRVQIVLTGHADASWVDNSATQRSSQGYTLSLGSGSVSLQSTHLSSVLSSSCETEIHAGAMGAQELR